MPWHLPRCTFAFFVVKIIIPMNTMTATILDGNKIAAQIKSEVAEEVQKLSAAGIRPGLAVILAGHNPASEIYVRNKVKSCQQLGMLSENLTPPDSVTTAELLQMVNVLNNRDEIDGILVQLPLPAQVDSKESFAGSLSGKRCGRISSRERGQSFHAASGAGAVYAGRCD